MSNSAPEQWEFYYCQVDDAPASIFLNLGYQEARPAGLDTLYFAGLEILEPGDYGLGVDSENTLLCELEDRISDATAKAGLCFVGRLRNDGDWQLTFYGPAGNEEELEQIVVRALGESERGYRVGSQADADWEYYEEFLLPDAERWQWIMNRRVVQSLADAGDDHETSRPVDHFVRFADAAHRDAFLAAAKARGFSGKAGPTKDDAELPYTAALVRSDPVELEHIHEVVMDLIDLAEEHGGDYDGWGAPIAKRE